MVRLPIGDRGLDTTGLAELIGLSEDALAQHFDLTLSVGLETTSHSS